MDLANGPEFPRWFVGGELNWVDTILRRAGDPDWAGCPAVIVEREAGIVTQTSFAEVRGMVLGLAHGLHGLGIQPGDRVGLLMETGLEAVVSLLAVASSNAAERALRGIALGRRSWLFCGSDGGEQRAAVMYSLIVTAKMNGVNPQAWLADILARIADHPAHRLDDLLPWWWASQVNAVNQAA